MIGRPLWDNLSAQDAQQKFAPCPPADYFRRDSPAEGGIGSPAAGLGGAAKTRGLGRHTFGLEFL